MVLACAVLLANAAPAWAGTWRFTDLVSTAGAAFGSHANAINNAGQVVGSGATLYYDSDREVDYTKPQATLWTGGVPTHLANVSNIFFSEARAINRHGMVIGSAYLDLDSGREVDLFLQGMVFSSGGSARLPSGDTYAWYETRGLNDAGQVVGRIAQDIRQDYVIDKAVRWNDAASLYDTLPGGTDAIDINNAGQVVGQDADGNVLRWDDGTAVRNFGIGVPHAIDDLGRIVGERAGRATLWHDGGTTDLGTLGGAASRATAINLAGVVVGASQNAEGAWRATLWNGARGKDLNRFLDAETVAAGWVLESANGINDRGAIVGDARNTLTNVTHGYVLTTVPEPGTPLLMCGGLVLAGTVARQCRRGAR